jgi:hypothetical protein
MPNAQKNLIALVDDTFIVKINRITVILFLTEDPLDFCSAGTNKDFINRLEPRKYQVFIKINISKIIFIERLIEFH